MNAAELIVDEAHYRTVVVGGMLKATTSLAIATADFKAMLAPLPQLTQPRGRRSAPSIVAHLRRLAQRGVEIRLLHAGVPSSMALRELRKELPENLLIRRCPRLHAKAVVVDARRMYLGSANLTGAGLGAKSPDRRNIEWGIWTSDAAMIDAVLAQFDRLWEGQRCATCQRHDICPQPLEEPKLS
ncbi:MAG: phospholipase D family protein [Phycisphaeraceae bacterium]|nr:phospholipase D family protein [Phycisphaeraceae bacterium]